MSFNEMDDASNSMKDSAMDSIKGGAKRGRKLGAKAIKKASAKVAQAAKQALMAFIKVAWPYLLGALCAILIFALIWTWFDEERGTTGSYSLDPDYQNVTAMDSNGIEQVVALTETQAYINAYYKYMSCSSYSKFVGPENIFTFRNETNDFAGLQDYYQKENYFYLSPDFIMMADELLHGGKFFYPEQLIKPVTYEWAENQLKLTPIVDKDGVFQAQSKQYNSEQTAQITATEPGLWDHGLGSVLKYEPFTKQKYISCEYTTYPVDVDVWVESDDGGAWEHSEVITVEIPKGATPAEAVSQLNMIILTHTAIGQMRCSGPSATVIEKLVKEQAHINMKLEGSDIDIGKRNFDDASLAEFSNKTEKYPIQIPLITSSALFSGTISYTYTNQLESRHLDEGTSGLNDTSMDSSDPVDHLFLGTSSCGETDFIIERKGAVNTEVPIQTEEKDEPCGFGYLSDYCDRYKAYVPIDVTKDLKFAARIEKDSKTRGLLNDLGLLTKYTGVVASGANYNVFKISGLTAADFDAVLKGTNLQGTGASWVSLEEAYGVNGLFAIAVSGQESGWGSSNLGITKHNLFGIYINGAWASFDSDDACIQYFGTLMTTQERGGQKLYLNKSIDEISVSYCTSGPSDWAKAIKSIMASDYTTLVANGASPSILSVNPSFQASSSLTASQAEVAIATSGKNINDLYQNTNFDVLSSTTMLQKLRNPNSGILSALENLFEDVKSQIMAFFDAINGVFMDHFDDSGERIVYGTQLPIRDIQNVVYKAISFSTDSLYSTVENAVRDDDLSFLFVGGESIIGLGTGAAQLVSVPGVETTIEGFISPTKINYQPIRPWEATVGGCELAVPNGTSILSVADGGIVSGLVKSSDGSGYQMTITYTVGSETYIVQYKYLASVNVSNGDTVNQGSQVGLSGKKSDGTACLFFGFTNAAGQNTNPLGYFYQPTYSSSAMADIAKAQVGQVGGAPFWGWYGFGARVEWCACFVSWCADQCGYLDAGSLVKFSSCSTEVEWLKFHNQWVQSTGTYQPVVGNIIFFDWEGDGEADHVGIVSGYQNGIVSTVEGNSGDYPGMVCEKTYNLFSKSILGFGLISAQQVAE